MSKRATPAPKRHRPDDIVPRVFCTVPPARRAARGCGLVCDPIAPTLREGNRAADTCDLLGLRQQLARRCSLLRSDGGGDRGGCPGGENGGEGLYAASSSWP